MNSESESQFIPKKETQIEQKKQIPELIIHKTAPSMEEGEAKNILKEQWAKFWQLRFTNQKSEMSAEAAQNIASLKEGFLLHHLPYSETALSKILQSGILSSELGYDEKETNIEDAETHYCADFFVNQKNQSVQEYINYAHGNEENTGMLKKKRMESYNCPLERNDNIAIVIDPNRPELAELLQRSATGIDINRLENFSVRFPYGADKPGIAKRHLAVLIGIPANYISSIVIGGKLANDQEKITKLKELITNSKLDIPILNFKGGKI